MLHLNEHYATWIGRTLTDASGHKIGRIDDIYTDDDTGQPEWLAVTAGLMGPDTHHFVPLRAATLSGDGVQVPFPKDRVKVAPSAGAEGRLARMEKGRLYAHYGYSYAEERNRLQRSLGFDPPGQSRPPDGRDEGRALDLRELGPAPTPEVSAGPAPTPEVSRPGLAPAPEVSRPGPAPAPEVSRPGPAPAPEVRHPGSASTPEVSRPGPVPTPGVSRPGHASTPEVRRPAGRPDEVAPLLPPRRSDDRGRWPDDDAIFGLIQAAQPLATSGAPRRR